MNELSSMSTVINSVTGTAEEYQAAQQKLSEKPSTGGVLDNNARIQWLNLKLKRRLLFAWYMYDTSVMPSVCGVPCGVSVRPPKNAEKLRTKEFDRTSKEVRRKFEGSSKKLRRNFEETSKFSSKFFGETFRYFGDSSSELISSKIESIRDCILEYFILFELIELSRSSQITVERFP